MSKSEDRRLRWRRIIFEHDTPAGRAYDVVLIIAILMSVAVVTLEMQKAARALESTRGRCGGCGRENHDSDARFCKQCGAALPAV
jgi:voltage-gated potassium channel